VRRTKRRATENIVSNGSDCGTELIIMKLTPEKYTETSRAHLLDATDRQPGRPVVWSHPAFANRCVLTVSFVRLICYFTFETSAAGNSREGCDLRGIKNKMTI
jgi:hypothetical protein